MQRASKSRSHRKLLVALAALVVLLAAGAAWANTAAPGILLRLLERRAAAAGLQLTVDHVDVRPLSLGATFDQLTVARPRPGEKPAPILQADRLHLELSGLALLRGQLRASGSLHGARMDVPRDAAPLFARVREELLDAPAIVVELLRIEDGSVTLHPRELRGSVTVRELDGRIRGMRSRPAPPGELPTQVELSGTAGDNSLVRIRLRGDLLDEQPELTLSTVASRVPLSLVSEASRQQTGLEVKGGSLDVRVEATLGDGAYEGELRTRIAGSPELEHEGSGLVGELQEQLGEAAAPEGAGRAVHFSGDVDPADAPLPAALQQLAQAALHELSEGLVGEKG